MSLILVVDDAAVVREPIAAALRARGYATLCAGSGAEALEAIDRFVPDLIVLDLSMPGMDGLAVLRALRVDPLAFKTPVILLTGSGDKEHIIEAGRLGVRDYVLKSRFNLDELVCRIQRCLGHAHHEAPPPAPPHAPSAEQAAAVAVPRPAQAPPTTRAGAATPTAPPTAPLTPPASAKAPVRLTREETTARVEACAQTRTLPGVVAELITLVNSARTDVSDLAALLKTDPVLASRVLAVANSAAFASQKPRIATIDEAARNIGVAGIRALVFSVGIFESFARSGAEGTLITRCWQHSFAMATVMDRLPLPADSAAAGVAHLAGLCYDLCDIVLRQHFPAECRAVADAVAQTGRPAWQVRAAVFGMPYHDLVMLVLAKLGLPAPITSPIGEAFARSASKDEGRGPGMLARALRIANVYAHGLMLAAEADAPVGPFTVAEYRGAFGDAPPPELDPKLLRSEVLTAVNVMAGVSSAQASELCRPLVASGSGRILYWRHPSYSELDPLAALLGFAGTVEVRTDPPEAAGLADCDAVVVAGPRQEAAAAAQLTTLCNLLGTGNRPALYLSGLSPERTPQAGPVLCRPLPVSLADAAAFLNRIRPALPAAA